MNTKTHTTTTEGYPEAGPFETRGEAMGVPLVLVLSVELREDGWYRTYVRSTTSTIYPGPYEYKLGPWWRRILRRARE